ncbi:MAG TPA: PASTA domain-containing protein [Actinophytocola sp.]|nr:PASTA domain-containing protein [Actinophytocola sp.]HEV2782959.1 PASTA domain-containing protein [Actinophytocola sp.]
MEDAASLAGALLEQRYRVDALLARGGMSSVYRGVDTRLDRPVAIKVMDPRFAADRAFVDRFEREARSAARIHHPNVVAVHDQGLDGDHVFLVMELVDGGTLRDLLAERGALGVPLALSIMEPVLGALAAAHRAGLVHRDVKPENVLIGANGAVKVGDFGLVRAVASAGTTSSSVILGTVAYLSPEQVTTGTATARGDVYSAGILLYEMLTGTPPYTGDNALSIAYRHVNDDVPAPTPASGALPAELAELVLRATRRDPSARPLDAGAFLLELQRIRATVPIPAVPIPVPRHHLVDRTLPVTAEDQVRALGLEVPIDAGSTSGTLDAHGPDAGTVAPVASATLVSHAPQGFQAVGPRGTKAWLRTDLEPPGPPPGAPPSAPVPVLTAAPPPFTPQSPPYGTHPPTGGQPVHAPPRPPNRNRRIVLLSLVGVLVVALVSTATWWFAAGRWTSVPSVAGLDRASAERQLTESDLSPQLVQVRHNDIAAGLVITTEPAGGAEALRGDQIKLIVSMGRPKVPNVKPGIAFEEAARALEDADLQPQRDDGRNEFNDTVPKGAVVGLDPAPGTELTIDTPVKIVVSKGPKPKPVPDVRGKTRDEAFQVLREAGFEPFDAGAEFAGDVDGGKVVRTNPPAGKELGDTDGKRVGVFLSSAVTVPDVSQRTVTEARNALQALGLQVEAAHLAPPDQSRVIAQNPLPGSRVEAGSKVSIFGFP